MIHHIMKKGATATEYAWHELANAIVIQAAKDYICLLRDEPVMYATGMVSLRECELFFDSSYCTALTGVDGQYIKAVCRKRAKNELIY